MSSQAYASGPRVAVTTWNDERAEIELINQVKNLVGAFADVRPVFVPYGGYSSRARTGNPLTSATSAAFDLGFGNLTVALSRVINDLTAATHTRHDGADYLFVEEPPSLVPTNLWQELSQIRVRDDGDFELPWA